MKRALAKKYAAAASWAAQRASLAQDELAAQTKIFLTHLQENTDLKRALGHPGMRRHHDVLVCEIAQSLQLSSVCTNLLRLLTRYRRLPLLAYIVEQFERSADARLGKTRAVVQCVAPLTQAQQQRLCDVLSRLVDSQVYVQTQNNPKILGGVICQLGDLRLDMSLRKQLACMQQQLLADDGKP